MAKHTQATHWFNRAQLLRANMSVCQRYRVSRCLAKGFLKGQSSPQVQTRNLSMCRWHHDVDRNSYRKLCVKHFQRLSSASEFRRLSTYFHVLKTPCLCLKRPEKLCSMESNLKTFLTLKKCMSTNSSNFSLRHPVMKDYVDSLVEEYKELEKQVDETRDRRTQTRLMELSPVVDIARILKSRYKELEELMKLQAGKEFLNKIHCYINEFFSGFMRESVYRVSGQLHVNGIMRNTAFRICKQKGADQLTDKVDQCLNVFNTFQYNPSTS